MDAVLYIGELPEGVGVGRDSDTNAKLFGEPQMNVVQVDI